jgi:hypothetical protein
MLVAVDKCIAGVFVGCAAICASADWLRGGAASEVKLMAHAVFGGVVYRPYMRNMLERSSMRTTTDSMHH